MNYSVYRFNSKERIKYLLLYLMISAAIAVLFYDSVYYIIFLFPGIIPFSKTIKRSLIKKRSKQLGRQFRDMSEALMTALNSGFSIENAFKEALKDMDKLYGTNSMISKELKGIIKKLDNGVTLENSLSEFANRSKNEDVRDFADIFSVAKRSGGSYAKILSRIVRIMREKDDTENEIDTMLSGKHLEQKVLGVIPIVIIAYLRLSTGKYMEVLYHNIVGITTMSVCLVLYFISFSLSGKISNIEV